MSSSVKQKTAMNPYILPYFQSHQKIPKTTVFGIFYKLIKRQIHFNMLQLYHVSVLCDPLLHFDREPERIDT